MRKYFELILFFLCANALACGQFSIDVAPSSVSLKSGAQQQFLVSESNAQNPNGAWSVLPSNCGPIDASGMFTAANVTADQSCSISFTDAQNGKSASALVTVISPFDGPAELPHSVPNSSMASTPAPGKVIPAPPLGLQTAINSAACGDTVQLEAGVSYSGAYTLPAKPCDDGHWVVIRTCGTRFRIASRRDPHQSLLLGRVVSAWPSDVWLLCGFIAWGDGEDYRNQECRVR
jgi:hypothetical protein